MTKRPDPHNPPQRPDALDPGQGEAVSDDALRSAEWMPVYVPGSEQSALFDLDASASSRGSLPSTTTQAVGGSTLFQLDGAPANPEADPDADDFMPVYLPAGVKSSPQNPRVELGAHHDAAAATTDDNNENDDDFLPLYLSPTAPGGTSTLFDLARLGAQIPVKLAPTGGSTLFRLADGSAPDADPEDDEDFLPVYLSGSLPGDLTQPRTRQHSSLFLLGDAEGGGEDDEDFLPVFVSGQVPPPSPSSTSSTSAEAALDARLRQQTRRVIAPPKPKPTPSPPPAQTSKRRYDPRPQRAIPSVLWEGDSELIPLTLADTRPTHRARATSSPSIEIDPVASERVKLTGPAAPQMDPGRMTFAGSPLVSMRVAEDGDVDWLGDLKGNSPPSPAGSGMRFFEPTPMPQPRPTIPDSSPTIPPKPTRRGASWINQLPEALRRLPRVELLALVDHLIATSTPPTPEQSSANKTGEFKRDAQTGRWRQAESAFLKWLSSRLEHSDQLFQTLQEIRKDLLK